MFIAQLDRFGYMLTAIGSTEEEAKETIIEEYIGTFIAEDGMNPAEIPLWNDEERSYLDLAKEDINITEINSGEVAWL